MMLRKQINYGKLPFLGGVAFLRKNAPPWKQKDYVFDLNLTSDSTTEFFLTESEELKITENVVKSHFSRI